MIHFAGRKAVGESVQQPWLYYDHNVLGAINLVEVMRKHNVKNVSVHAPPPLPSHGMLHVEGPGSSGRVQALQSHAGFASCAELHCDSCEGVWLGMMPISQSDTEREGTRPQVSISSAHRVATLAGTEVKTPSATAQCLVWRFCGMPQKTVGKPLSSCWLAQMVFSSSCTVYGNPSKVPIDESHSLAAVSPYGRTKLIIEEIFRDYSAADSQWRTILLRYFNPVGAHPSGPAPPPPAVSLVALPEGLGVMHTWMRAPGRRHWQAPDQDA